MNITAELDKIRQIVIEAHEARVRDGVVSEKADAVYAAVIAGDDTPLYRVLGVSAPAVDPLQRLAGHHARTARVSAPKAAPERRANKYGARCIACNAWVEAEAGYLAKTAAGKWAAEHKAGECVQAQTVSPVAQRAAQATEKGQAYTEVVYLQSGELQEAHSSTVAPRTPAPKLTVTDGFYELDGVAYKVQQNQAGTGLYGKKLVEGSWEYVPGVVRVLQQGGATKLTEELASKLGELYGRCVICGRKLTAEESIERSIGRICYEKNF